MSNTPGELIFPPLSDIFGDGGTGGGPAPEGAISNRGQLISDFAQRLHTGEGSPPPDDRGQPIRCARTRKFRGGRQVEAASALIPQAEIVRGEHPGAIAHLIFISERSGPGRAEPLRRGCGAMDESRTSRSSR